MLFSCLTVNTVLLVEEVLDTIKHKHGQFQVDHYDDELMQPCHGNERTGRKKEKMKTKMYVFNPGKKRDKGTRRTIIHTHRLTCVHVVHISLQLLA